MTSDAPTVFVPLAAEPVVSQHLCIKIMRLKRGMMHVRPGTFKEKEAMMID